MSAVTVAESGGVAGVTLDVPDRSANVLSEPVIHELVNIIEEVAARPEVRAIVLRGKPSGFCVGADVAAIGAVHDRAEGERLAAMGQAAFLRVERLSKPLVVAVRGPCLGGGLELALACDGIIAADAPSTRLGLPEVRLGIVPGFGGTQRLPRRIGMMAALDMIVAGKLLRARKALRIGLVDALADPAYLDREADAYALALADGGARRNARARRGWIRRLVDGFGPLRGLVKSKAEATVRTKTRGVFPAPLRAIDLVARSFEGPEAAGYSAEAVAVGDLLADSVSHHLVRLFQTTEDLKRAAGDAVGLERGARVGVVGAGVMGADIATLLVQKGARVRLIDVDKAGLQRGVMRVGQALEDAGKRGHMSPIEVARARDRLDPSTSIDGLQGVTAVIEAIVERQSVKESVFRDIELSVPPDAALYTNTSSLRVSEIAASIGSGERVLGLHFFNPVGKMPLVEVVATSDADPRRVARAIALARDLGKIPVVTQDTPGFLVNRVLAPYLSEAMLLLEEGMDPEVLDGLMLDLGFAMGPLRVLDTVGLDVAGHAAESLRAFLGLRLPTPSLGSILVEGGHLGDKAGGGIYVRGKKGGRKAAPHLAAAIAAARRRDVVKAAPPSLADARDRMFLAMLAEAARASQDGVVADPAHLDAAMVLGAGFPPNRGGPLRELDRMGMQSATDRLATLASRFGERFRPADGLMAMVRTTARFHEDASS